MRRFLSVCSAVLAAVLLVGGVGAAKAETYTFSQLIGSSSTEPTDQFTMVATQSGTDAISFTFYNNVGETSSITDIYVTGTDGLLLTPGEITDQSAGVDFSVGADPANLPVGTSYDFYATAGADSNPPVWENGINQTGEYVTWTFALASGVTYDDVIAAINSGELSIGLRAPGYSGGSASFINTCSIAGCSTSPSIDTAAIPLPASLWLMLGAMGGLALLSRFVRRRDGTAGPAQRDILSCLTALPLFFHNVSRDRSCGVRTSPNPSIITFHKYVKRGYGSSELQS